MSTDELLPRLERDAAQPLHVQLADELRGAIRSGRLRAGTALPASRVLAERLGVSRGVVVEAYGRLAAEGYLAARAGSGTRVTATGSAPAPRIRRRDAATCRYDFDPSLPDLAGFPREAWQRSARRALLGAPAGALGHGHPRGTGALREALAAHLGPARSVVADPERILVCAGTVQGVTLTCAVLRARGARRLAVEDPGWAVRRTVAARAGLDPVPVPVDSRGIDVQELARTGADAVLLTPAHQAATGAVLSADRRTALLEWAERTDALIIEDDGDADYRYDREPVGALQGLAPERVLYIGSAGRILAPGLRLGWLVAPSWLVDALVHEKGLTDLGPRVPDQLALADFVRRGELERHLRRTRRRYRTRRTALLAALARHLPDAHVAGVTAGLHAVVLLPDGTDERALIAAARDRGIAIDGLSWMRAQPEDGPPGLLLGFAALPEGAIEQGVAELAGCLA